MNMYKISFNNFLYNMDENEYMEFKKKSVSEEKTKCIKLVSGHVKKKELKSLMEELKCMCFDSEKLNELIEEIVLNIEIHLCGEYLTNPDLYMRVGDIYLQKSVITNRLYEYNVNRLHNFESEKFMKNGEILFPNVINKFLEDQGFYPSLNYKKQYSDFWIHDFDKTTELNSSFGKTLIRGIFEMKIKDKLVNFSKDDKYIVYMIYYKYTPSKEVLRDLKEEIEKYLTPEELEKVDVKFWASRYPNYDHDHLEKLGYDFEIRDDIIISW